MASRIARVASLPGIPLSVDVAAWVGRGDIVVRGRTLGLFLAVLVCSSCSSMQVQPRAQREVLLCQGPTAENVHCRPADIRAVERAIFGPPGQRR